MHTAPSRREKREFKFLYLAERGEMLCNAFSLYKSEEKTLKDKHGFYVVRHGDNLKGELPSTVSWENPFKGGIPLVVNNYCTGFIDTFPKSAIKNWAQELFVIAARANFEKNHKDGKKLSGMAQSTSNE